MKLLLEQLRFLNAVPPAADPFDGTKYSAGINVSGLEKLFIVVQKGVGVTGTTTLTVVAADGASPLSETAITFNYLRIPANNLITSSLPTKAATTGFITTAGSGDMYILEVDVQAMAQTEFKYVALKMVEGTNSPVLGSVLFFGTPAIAPSVADIAS